MILGMFGLSNFSGISLVVMMSSLILQRSIKVVDVTAMHNSDLNKVVNEYRLINIGLSYS